MLICQTAFDGGTDAQQRRPAAHHRHRVRHVHQVYDPNEGRGGLFGRQRVDAADRGQHDPPLPRHLLRIPVQAWDTNRGRHVGERHLHRIEACIGWWTGPQDRRHRIVAGAKPARRCQHASGVRSPCRRDDAPPSGAIASPLRQDQAHEGVADRFGPHDRRGWCRPGPVHIRHLFHRGGREGRPFVQRTNHRQLDAGSGGAGQRCPGDGLEVLGGADTRALQRLDDPFHAVQQQFVHRDQSVEGVTVNLLQRQTDQKCVATGAQQQTPDVVVGRSPVRVLDWLEHQPHLPGAERRRGSQRQKRPPEAAPLGRPGAILCLVQFEFRRQRLVDDDQAHRMAKAPFIRQ